MSFIVVESSLSPLSDKGAQSSPPSCPIQPSKILTGMKPIVSAAAAALLLVGGRRGGAQLPPIRPPDDDGDRDVDSPYVEIEEHLTNNSQDEFTTSDDKTMSSRSEDGVVETVRTMRIPRFPSPADWDWSDTPDYASIWDATAAILSGARLRSSGDFDGDDDDDSRRKRFKDAVETLSAALRGLGSQQTVTQQQATKDIGGEGDGDSATVNDFRPLIAVTIGVTLFLLTRSPKAARRRELEVGANDGSVVVDDDDLLTESTVDWSARSDLRSHSRDIVIITTAALPWMTGTAVNPLLRAVYLAKAGHSVSLFVPWLESPEDQRVVFPKGTQFASRDDQARVILQWARDQVPDVQLRIRFYEGVYSSEFGSILPLRDITTMFGDDDPCDVCVLEEPEHLTWFHTGRRWTSLFRFCVGIVHTNYLEYAKKHGVFGPQRALFLNFLNKWVCRSYCHRVIKLSDAVQTLPHSVTCNVHGVRNKFIQIGCDRQGRPFEDGAYFLGKVLWAKGYQQLVELMEDHHKRTEERLPIDFFGAGPDLEAVRARVDDNYALSRVQIHGVVVDHASEYLQRYKVYVNPSKSDVVCTATAEALAMGKFVVCLKHPSNEFFATFDNCLIYETPEQFSLQLKHALRNEPKPLSDEDAYRLSWEAATERFYDASYVPSASGSGRVDSALALTHKTICATLITPPANNAVRARYRRERKNLMDELARLRRSERSKRVSVP